MREPMPPGEFAAALKAVRTGYRTYDEVAHGHAAVAAPAYAPPEMACLDFKGDVTTGRLTAPQVVMATRLEAGRPERDRAQGMAAVTKLDLCGQASPIETQVRAAPRPFEAGSDGRTPQAVRPAPTAPRPLADSIVRHSAGDVSAPLFVGPPGRTAPGVGFTMSAPGERA
jgi:hypothetical protein